MPTVFLSHSREDLPLIEQLEAQLKGHPEISIWRDQEKIFGGQKWPKVLGEAIADQDVFLLAWWKSAAASHFVELGWIAALALKKAVISCPLDNSPLPPFLRGTNTIAIADVAKIVAAITRSHFVQDIGHREEIVSRLDQMTATRPEDVLNTAQSILNQRDWTVQGTVIKGEHVTVHVRKGSESFTQNSLESWRDWIAFAVGIVGLIISLPMFINPLINTNPELTAPMPSLPTVIVEPPKPQTLGGLIRDERSDPLDGVKVSLPQFNLTATTDQFGQFRFEVMASDQETVAFLAQKPGYRTYEADVTLGNSALGFTMRKNP